MSDSTDVRTRSTGRASALTLVAGLLALVALALGLWDLFVERDGGGSLLWQVVFPALLVVLFLVMYVRGRGRP